MSSTDTEGIDLSFFAPIYWGFVISLFLGGITIVQAYIYFPHRNDRLIVQITAFFMLILDFISSALVAETIYYYLIPHFGSLAPLSSVTPELSAECLISTIITFISQMYFVQQLIIVKRLGKGSWIFIGLIGILGILAFVGGVACVVTMYVFHHGVLSTNRNGMFSIFFGLAKGFGAATDIAATIAMCFFLTSSRTGMDRTNSILKSLIQFVIHRGALVTLIQTLLLISFFALPTKLTWLAFHINVTKLYANTFFAMLNGRDSLKEKQFAMATSFVNPPSIGRAKNRADHGQDSDDQYHLSRVEVQDDFNQKMTLDMPTITRTVVVADV